MGQTNAVKVGCYCTMNKKKDEGVGVWKSISLPAGAVGASEVISDNLWVPREWKNGLNNT